MITLGHVNIRTDRLEETCRFYEDLLGLVRGMAATAPDPSRNIWLHDPAGQPCVHLNRLRDGETACPESTAPLNHIAFNCPDRDGMAARLQGMGVSYTVVETIVPGVTQFNLSDPNGVAVELTFGHDRLVRSPAAST